jgi:hypothetical protein
VRKAWACPAGGQEDPERETPLEGRPSPRSNAGPLVHPRRAETPVEIGGRGSSAGWKSSDGGENQTNGAMPRHGHEHLHTPTGPARACQGMPQRTKASGRGLIPGQSRRVDCTQSERRKHWVTMRGTMPARARRQSPQPMHWTSAGCRGCYCRGRQAGRDGVLGQSGAEWAHHLPFAVCRSTPVMRSQCASVAGRDRTQVSRANVVARRTTGGHCRGCSQEGRKEGRKERIWPG